MNTSRHAGKGKNSLSPLCMFHQYLLSKVLETSLICSFWQVPYVGLVWKRGSVETIPFGEFALPGCARSLSICKVEQQNLSLMQLSLLTLLPFTYLKLKLIKVEEKRDAVISWTRKKKIRFIYVFVFLSKYGTEFEFWNFIIYLRNVFLFLCSNVQKYFVIEM